jgi:CubicO group peptidase (beta-lactamase class C family)
MRDGGEHTDWSARLRELAARAGVPGAVLGIWAGGKEILAAHGVVNAATQVATTTDSLFQVGSISKVWTATMAAQLVGEGRVSLDTTVAEVLPGLRLSTGDVGGEVTVRHLLTHTAGFDGDIFTDTGRGGDCLERYAAGLSGAAQTFAPGAGYSYCNSGYCLLGRIIEVLDGREWDESLRKRLIEPLGLTGTVTLPEEAIFHRAAVGHRKPPDEARTVSAWALPRSLAPAGGIISSAHDLLAFARLHLDGGVTGDGTRLLSEALVAAMREPRFDIPGLGDRDDEIGLGWRLRRWGDHQMFGHDGDTIGQSAFLRIDEGERVAACLLTNSPVADVLCRELFTEVFGTYAGAVMPPGPEPAADPSGVDASRYTGRYERTSRRIDIYLRDGQPRITYTTTGDLASLTSADSEDLALYPADHRGGNFLARSDSKDPWSSVSFSTFPDKTPYVFISGRLTPKTG